MPCPLRISVFRSSISCTAADAFTAAFYISVFAVLVGQALRLLISFLRSRKVTLLFTRFVFKPISSDRLFYLSLYLYIECIFLLIKYITLSEDIFHCVREFTLYTAEKSVVFLNDLDSIVLLCLDIFYL